jgi:diaminopimelate epimerase
MKQPMHFFKYHGTGNDFIILQDPDGSIEMLLDSSMIHEMCRRHFGIGADGLMLLQKSSGYGFRMVYYNADGKESTFCGNGSRCITALAHHLGWIGDETWFVASDGDHNARVSKDGDIAVKMISVKSITANDQEYILNTGSPHLVRFVENLDETDLIKTAREIRYSDRWREEGININLVQIQENGLKMRTYERGVEDETLSCGTGTTAAALSWAWHNRVEGLGKISVFTPGGQLTVTWMLGLHGFTDIWLSGPAKLVFEGDISL